MKTTDRFENALVAATRLHQGQIRKGTGVPYVMHLLAVAALVGEAGGTEDEVIGALLHDAAEDQGGAWALDLVRAQFGPQVAALVEGCSDTFARPKPPWKERKEAYIAHLGEASPSVRLVSCADKLHNARSILVDLRTKGEAAWSIFKGGKEGTLWYYRSLVGAFRKHGAPLAILDELDRAVTEMEREAAATGRTSA